MITRRGFLFGMAGILAASQAPAFVQAGSLMRVNPDHIVIPHYTQGLGTNVLVPTCTNFAALTDAQRAMWSRALWREARTASFLETFYAGSRWPPHVVQQL